MKNNSHIKSEKVGKPPSEIPRLLLGVPTDDDPPYPFEGHALARQMRKHGSLRGTEARFVRNAGATTYSGIRPISRLKNAVKGFESSTESDFWLMADMMMHDMVDAQSQPGKVQWIEDDRVQTWYPDGWFRRLMRKDLLAEIKPIAVACPDREKYPEQAALMARRLAGIKWATESLGMEFALFTELEIRLEPRFHNAKTMRRAISSHIPSSVVEGVEAELSGMPCCMTVLEFSRHLGPYAGMALNIACLLDLSAVSTHGTDSGLRFKECFGLVV